MDKHLEADLNRAWAEYEDILQWSGDITADARWIGFMVYYTHRAARRPSIYRHTKYADEANGGA